MLNTNSLSGSVLKDEQYNWLVDELKNNTCKWTIVSMHNPMYSIGKWGSDSSKNAIALGLQAQLRKIFDKYGVDLVLQGHDHAISRTFPIDGAGSVQTENLVQMNGIEYSINPNGVVYVMNGTGGTQNRGAEGDVIWDLYKYGEKSNDGSWAEITIDGDMLTVTVKYYDDGQEKTYYTWGIIKQIGMDNDFPIIWN